MLTQIAPVQKKQGGGLFGKIFGGIASAVKIIPGIGEIADIGKKTVDTVDKASKIGDFVGGVAGAGQAVSGMVNPAKSGQSSALQTFQSDPDQLALKVMDAQKAANNSAIPEPDRLQLNQTYNQTLAALRARKNQGIV